MRLNKQSALKAALLLALAANTSWNVHQQMNSTELALMGAADSSDAVPVNGAGGTAQQATAAPAGPPRTPETLVVRAALPVPAANPPPRASKTQLAQSDEEKTVCGEPYQILYREIQQNNQPWVEVLFKKRGSAEEWAGTGIRIPGDLTANFTRKQELETKAVTEIKATRSRNKLACAGEATATAAVAATETPTTEDKAKRDRIAREVKECRADTDGTRLAKTGQLECWLAKLESADQIEKDPRKKARFSRFRDRDDDDDKQIYNRIRDIANNKLRPLIKEMMLSRKSGDQDAAIEAAEDASATIKEFADTLDLNERAGKLTIYKLAKEFEGLAMGGKAVEKTREHEDDAREVRDRYRTAKAEYIRNPLNMGAYANLQSAEQDLLNFSTMMTNDIGVQMLSPLQAYRNMGYITSKDMTDFSSPFEAIKKLIMGVNNPELDRGIARPTGAITTSLMGSDFVIPVNMSASRSVGGDGALRSGGFTVPMTAPVLNFPKSAGEPYSLTSGRTLRLN